MTVLIAIGISLAVTLPAALMAAEVAATALLAPPRIRRLVESERRGASSLEALTGNAYRFRASAAFSSAFAYSFCTASAIWAAIDLADGTAAWLAAVIGAAVATAFVFSFGHALPRLIGVRNPEDVSLSFAPAALRVSRALYPFAKALAALWSWLMSLVVGSRVPSPWITEDEFRAYMPADEEAAREETEEALIEAVSDFADKDVREVMVPRTDMTCLPDDADARDAIAIIEEMGYSRLPVYHETVDDIRGVLYAKDLLAALTKDPYVRPVKIARKAYYVPETKPVQELLMEMRSRTHIAIVADEYGGTAGLVTIEDLLEEIVGEIFDEYDSEVPLVIEMTDERFRVDARLPVDDFNEQFGTAIEMDADTVGGVVTEVAGRIPEVGDAIEVDGLRIVVTELEGTRIRQLVVQSTAVDEREGHDA